MWMFQQIRSPAQDGNSEFNKLKEVQFVIQLNTFFNIYLRNSLRTLFAIFIPKGGSFTKKTCGWCWASQFLRIPMDGNYFQISNVYDFNDTHFISLFVQRLPYFTNQLQKQSRNFNAEAQLFPTDMFWLLHIVSNIAPKCLFDLER